MRTLRLSASSNYTTPLSGAGTLFNLNMTRVSNTPGASTGLTWETSPNNFVYIDNALTAHSPISTPPGSITVLGQMTIAGHISYCSNPAPGPVPGVTLTLTGDTTASTQTDASGDYELSSQVTSGNYVVTPSKAALAPTSLGITTVDVIATQRHFLGLTTLPPGCRLEAADVNSDNNISTIDVVAIQRFYLGVTAGFANTGKYKFTPANRSYSGGVATHNGEDYDVFVFGDVIAPFADRPSESAPSAPDREADPNELPAAVAKVALPVTTKERAYATFVLPVTTTSIDPKDKLVGFQGDLTFDERVIRFGHEPVQKAGLTSGDWNVSGNVLDGRGPIRTLRVSAFSNNFEPLSGSGALFNLILSPGTERMDNAAFNWAEPPNHFFFIDADLKTQRPIATPPGNISR